MLLITLADFVLGLFVGAYALASFAPSYLARRIYQYSWPICLVFVALAYVQTTVKPAPNINDNDAVYAVSLNPKLLQASDVEALVRELPKISSDVDAEVLRARFAQKKRKVQVLDEASAQQYQSVKRLLSAPAGSQVTKTPVEFTRGDIKIFGAAVLLGIAIVLFGGLYWTYRDEPEAIA